MSGTISLRKRILPLLAASLLLAVAFTPARTINAADCTWTHLVQAGDTLSSIAQYYGVSIGDILRLNSQISSPNLIQYGTTICISDTKSPPDLLPGVYRIQPGDTLADIARRFGITLVELARANGLGNPNLIFAGNTVTVPSPETATPAPSPEPTVEVTPEATPEATSEAVG